MSRTLLAQRLKQLERMGLIERREPQPTYHLTPAGQDLQEVVFGIGDWAKRWLMGDPEKEHLDGAHLLWRIRQRLVVEALPERRTVLQFDFPNAQRGRLIWLLLDREGSSVCERDEGFEVDVHVRADIAEMMRVWAGRTSWQDAMSEGKVAIEGPRGLVRDFPRWFALSPFVTRA